MEWILLIAVFFIYATIREQIDKYKDSTKNSSHKNLTTNKDLLDKKQQNIVLDKTYERTSVSEEKTTVNNYYTQNNVYIQQNNYHLKSSEENKDHSQKVWKRLGYKIKRGETYSYKFYGNEIYTPNQVEQIGCNQVKYSESGLTKKLLKDTKSKSLTQNILIDNYGMSKSTAKRLTDSY